MKNLKVKSESIRRILIKENNGGGISFEAYDGMLDILFVIGGLEFEDKTVRERIQDAKDLIAGEWDYTDATQWYNRTGNSEGAYKIILDDDGQDISDEYLTAEDVVDEDESTKILAVVEL
jgi:hypothetical protein